MGESPVLRITGLSKAFDRKPVLVNLTLQGAPGKTIGLLGRNGSGKTTLLRIIHDLIEPDAGTVEALGEKVDGSGKIRKRVGHLPDRPQFPRWKAREVLQWRARLLPGFSLTRAEAWAKGLALDLDAKLKRPSTGTAGKLGWLCACAHLPRLVLLDEPTNGLDFAARDFVLTRILPELRSAGSTILIANHHMEEVAELLDELWMLKNGGITVHAVNAKLVDRFRVSGLIQNESALPAELPVAIRRDGRYAVWLLNEAEFEVLQSSGAAIGLEREDLTAEDHLATQQKLAGVADA